MVEFALVLPLLALLLLALVQLGVVFSQHLVLTDAVRTGARAGALGGAPRDSGASAVTATREAATTLRQDELEVTVTSSWRRGDPVTVLAHYPFRVELLGFGVETGRLTATATHRVE